MHLRQLFFASTILLFTSSCTTQFLGSAKINGGPTACRNKCQNWGLQFAGMIAMGEYSDGCICRDPKIKADISLESAAAQAAAAGVAMQMQAEQARQQHGHR